MDKAEELKQKAKRPIQESFGMDKAYVFTESELDEYAQQEKKEELQKMWTAIGNLFMALNEQQNDKNQQ